MRNANLIVRDISILKLKDESNVPPEHHIYEQRLHKLVNKLDAAISAGMFKNQNRFLSNIKSHIRGEDLGKTTQTMLNAAFKSVSSPKTIAMLGKVLFSEKAIDEDYSLVLLYRLLEKCGLTIKAVRFGYDKLVIGVKNNKLLDFTEDIVVNTTQVFKNEDLLKALFILNDEPDEDISNLKECEMLSEYKRLIIEASGMKTLSLDEIPEYTSYPDMVLVMGLKAISQAGKTVEFSKEIFENFVIAIITKQSVEGIIA